MFRRHISRGPLFDAFYEGHLIVRNSTEPGLDSARALRAMGLTGLLEIWDDVLPYWRFRLEIERAAGLTIQEGEGRPILRKFKSFAGPKPVEGVSGKPAADIAQTPKKPPTSRWAVFSAHSDVSGGSDLPASAASISKSLDFPRRPK